MKIDIKYLAKGTQWGVVGRGLVLIAHEGLEERLLTTFVGVNSPPVDGKKGLISRNMSFSIRVGRNRC